MSRRDSKANADRIVEALLRLWAESSSPSMDQIAAESGLGVATVYRHYPNRAELERAAFKRIVDDEIVPIFDAVHEFPGAELIEVADKFIRTVGRYSPLLAAVGPDEFADDMIHEMGEPFVEMLNRGQERGFLRTDLEPSDIYWIIRLLVLGLNSPLASETIRRRFLVLIVSAVQPAGQDPLPPNSLQDYDNLSVLPQYRRPPTKN